MAKPGYRYAVSALRDQRSSIAGEIEHLRQRIARRKKNLDHIDASLRILDPTNDRATLPKKRFQKRVIRAVGEAFQGDGIHGIVDKQEVIIAKGPEAAKYYAKQILVKVERTPISGNPAHISTSYIERQNLTLRMSQRRLTRPSKDSARNTRITVPLSASTPPNTTSAGP